MSRFDDPAYDPPSRDELAREVLAPEEYAEYRTEVADRARVRNLARRHRAERLRDITDPWDAA